MTRIGIFYFSGTGNTEIVSQLLKKELEKKAHVEMTKIETVLKGKEFNVGEYDIVGMGYPIHALNAPKIFFDFVKRLPLANKKTFVYKCSADPFMMGGTTTMVRKALEEKGYHVFYEVLVLMPSNILVKYNDELVKQLYNAAVRRTAVIAEDVLQGKEKLQHNNVLYQLISESFSKLERAGTPYLGRDLTVRDSCTRCLYCVENCPTENISMVGGRITFGRKCVFCLRCVYGCPEKAITPRLYRWFVLRDYNIRNVIENPSIRGEFVSEKTTGYFKRFYQYLI